MDKVLLSGDFLLYPKKVPLQVVLTNKNLTIKNKLTKGAPEVISLADVIGCHVLQGNKTTSAQWYLCIFFYPLKKKVFKGHSRCRSTKSLGIACCDSDSENKSLAEKWKKAIKFITAGNNLTEDQTDCIPEIEQRHFVVYINPFSGRGKAMQIYKDHVKHVFCEAEIKSTVVKTEYAGHACKLSKEIELGKYDGIVIVSGDGLVHEVINGLMDRVDWEQAIKTPLGIVPGGSGNALAASIVYASTGHHPLPDVLPSSLFEICRGKICKVDILAMETSDASHVKKAKITYGILGTVIGLISDIDIESERLRSLGSQTRMLLYALMRIATMRRYNLTVSFLPAMADKEFGLSLETSAEQNDNAIHNAIKENYTAAGDATETLVNDLLPPLDEPVPSTWSVSQGEFLQVTGVNLSHIAVDTILHPTKKRSDGLLFLTQITANVNRRSLLKLWDSMEDGTGLTERDNSSDVVVTPCRAFRIVPHSKHSEIVTLDGEKMPYGPFQCQVHPQLGRVFGTNY
ncbi:unnamed protein product [Clavelina lepadiformis]|uniref:DAGKc domain-containing protein n=1 Tax=Clavelina lepadiformis TaxID=159417 RepID=A0ABP0GX86_CLALP